jgi:hypothetical protein
LGADAESGGAEADTAVGQRVAETQAEAEKKKLAAKAAEAAETAAKALQRRLALGLDEGASDEQCEAEEQMQTAAQAAAARALGKIAGPPAEHGAHFRTAHWRLAPGAPAGSSDGALARVQSVGRVPPATGRGVLLDTAQDGPERGTSVAVVCSVPRPSTQEVAAQHQEVVGCLRQIRQKLVAESVGGPTTGHPNWCPQPARAVEVAMDRRIIKCPVIYIFEHVPMEVGT